MSFLAVCMYTCHVVLPQEPEEGIRSPELDRVTGGCKHEC